MTPDFWDIKPDGIHITDQTDEESILIQEEWKDNRVIKYESWYYDNKLPFAKECKFNYKNNRKHGECKMYYENGSIRYIHNYYCGLQDGIQYGYYKGPENGKGQLKYHEEWKHGLKNGTFIWYYLSENNLIDTISEYQNDKFHGMCKGYYKYFHKEDINEQAIDRDTDPEQLLCYIRHYTHGKLYKKIEYNMFGEIDIEIKQNISSESGAQNENTISDSDDDSLFGSDNDSVSDDSI